MTAGLVCWFVGHGLAGLATVADKEAQPERAARLIGAVDAVCEAVASSLVQSPGQAARYTRMIDATRTQLGDETFAAVRAAPLAEANREAVVAPRPALEDPMRTGPAR